MIKFLLRRICLEMPLSLLVIFTVTFFLIRVAPGGPFSSEKNVSPEVLMELRRHYGLDHPLYIQYVNYLTSVVRGNLGPSFKYPGRKVSDLIADSFPVSFELDVMHWFLHCFSVLPQVCWQLRAAVHGAIT